MYETGSHFFCEIEEELNIGRDSISDKIIDVVLILRPIVENNMAFGNSMITPRVAQKIKQIEVNEKNKLPF